MQPSWQTKLRMADAPACKLGVHVTGDSCCSCGRCPWYGRRYSCCCPLPPATRASACICALMPRMHLPLLPHPRLWRPGRKGRGDDWPHACMHACAQYMTMQKECMTLLSTHTHTHTHTWHTQMDTHAWTHCSLTRSMTRCASTHACTHMHTITTSTPAWLHQHHQHTT